MTFKFASIPARIEFSSVSVRGREGDSTLQYPVKGKGKTAEVRREFAKYVY